MQEMRSDPHSRVNTDHTDRRNNKNCREMSDHLSAVLFLFSVLYMGKYISRVAAQKIPVFLAVVREFEE